MWKITSCLRIVPKFSTPKSRAIWFSSGIAIACSLAMLMEVAATRSLSASTAAFRGAFSASVVSTATVGGCNSSTGASATAVTVGAASATLLLTWLWAFTLAVLLLAFLIGLGIGQYIWISNCYNG
jgi:hypothetical protein